MVIDRPKTLETRKAARGSRSPKRRLGALLSGAALMSLAAIACSSKTMPGATLGTYDVVGTASADNCGAGLGAPDPWSFSVRLSKDGTTLYWNWLDGTPYVSGSLDSNNATTMTSSNTGNVDGTEAGAGPCSMTRIDTMGLTVPTGDAPETFSGTLSYAFSVAAGANCADQLTSGGGSYDTLPCTLTYALTAKREK